MVTCSQQYTESGECSIISTDLGSTLILPGSGPSNYSKVRHILILYCAQKDVLNGTSAVIFHEAVTLSGPARFRRELQLSTNA